MFTNPDIFKSGSLEQISAQLRFNIIEMSHKARSAHLGSCLSCVDILTALYFNILKVDPSNPEMPERDIFILSKGHAAMALYSVLAARGFFDPEMLKDYNQDGGVLAEHPPASGLAGVEAATGSLGHGLPISTGQALAMKLNHEPQRVFCLLSDGETNEGSVWEAALFASAQKLNNLICFIDYNKWQATGRSDEVLNITTHADKWSSFGWDVECIDGHDCQQIISAAHNPSEKPKMVIADTVKGRGVSFMEDDNNWHYRVPNPEEIQQAKQELGI